MVRCVFDPQVAHGPGILLTQKGRIATTLSVPSGPGSPV